MKNIIRTIIEFILNLCKKEHPIEEHPIEEHPIEESQMYQMMSSEVMQEHLKKLGLYTDKIDGKIGGNTRNAIQLFNTIFFNKKDSIYTEDTDRLLKIMYDSYCVSTKMKDEDWQFFNNFRKTEFKCKCGKCNGYGDGIAMRLVMILQLVRNVYGKSITISSGYRCQEHNKKIGGDKNSSHMKGLASDFRLDGMTKQEVIKYLQSLPNYKYAYTNEQNMKNAVHITVTE